MARLAPQGRRIPEDNMIPFQLETDLRNCFEDLKTQPLNVNRYDGPEGDLAFDITTADTFIAGILSSILDRATISEQAKAVLRDPMLVGLTWRGRQTQDAYLGDLPELLKNAEIIERARVLCLEALEWKMISRSD
jgi:hypothetical protein